MAVHEGVWDGRVWQNYVRVIHYMYEGSMTVMKCAVRVTDWFKVELRLHQP